jgi:hypothetical protein
MISLIYRVSVMIVYASKSVFRKFYAIIIIIVIIIVIIIPFVALVQNCLSFQRVCLNSLCH